MSCVYLRIAVEDARVGPQGVKEAVAMRLEPLGGVRVLEVKVREPEQIRMGPVSESDTGKRRR